MQDLICKAKIKGEKEEGLGIYEIKCKIYNAVTERALGYREKGDETVIWQNTTGNGAVSEYTVTV